jgi:hypothetical protein
MDGPMTTHPLTSTHPADTTPPPPSRRATGTIGLLSLALFIAAVLVAPKQDVTTPTQLHAFLKENGVLQAVAWLLTVLWGLTWLLFVVGLRRLLPESQGRDLFTAAAVAGQAATWAGVSLNTATAPSGAHGVTLPVYEAFGEAGHLAMAAGTAATGLALIGLARAAADAGFWSTTTTRVTVVAGTVLIVTAVIGPISIPVYVIWLLATSILLLRSKTASGTSAVLPQNPPRA